MYVLALIGYYAVIVYVLYRPTHITSYESLDVSSASSLEVSLIELVTIQ